MKSKPGAILLFIVLILFPAISWYYLSKGTSYRKEALKDLEIKEQYNTKEVSEIINIPLKGFNTLLIFPNKLSENQLEDIVNRFIKVNTFQCISTRSLPIDAKNFTIDSMSSLYSLLNKPNFALLDTLGQVRATFGDSREEINRLIRDTAVLLPYND
ncbi:MAG TPA: hypothetical protein PK147_08470 [Saprospiraceae bacterium]|nr:hypothetical protein [Saprospiraceae bacterium]MCB9328722.1 hypothetical protein [Lewinellaceae bacterium]HPQ21871.1 hypothetical protein [Saprospiraceae bacterium]HRX29210.1 hypothetical protein [Saprospiraceae bacterium]